MTEIDNENTPQLFKAKIKDLDERRWKNKESCFRSREKVREETLRYYGKGKAACVVCGESRRACVTLDHINSNGSEEFRRLKRKGTRLYQYLRSHGYPEGYQTLCMNCQWVKRYMNYEKNHIKG